MFPQISGRRAVVRVTTSSVRTSKQHNTVTDISSRSEAVSPEIVREHGELDARRQRRRLLRLKLRKMVSVAAQ